MALLVLQQMWVAVWLGMHLSVLHLQPRTTLCCDSTGHVEPYNAWYQQSVFLLFLTIAVIRLSLCSLLQ